MSQPRRQSNLFAAENWTAVYEAFRKINIQAYDFATIRASMVEYIRTVYPDDFNDWIDNSEFIFLLDTISFLGQNLSFRMDLNSRENFISLAQRKESVLRLANTLSYEAKRNYPARGLLKISQIITSEDIRDSNGRTIQNKPIIWNDPLNPDWREHFILAMNSSFSVNSQFGSPIKKVNKNSGSIQLYQMNTTSYTNITESFSKTIAGTNMQFEVVNPDFDSNGTFFERTPDVQNLNHVIYQTDGNGDASIGTGFFLYFKQGTLNYDDYNFSNKIENRQLTIARDNINQLDFWVQEINQDSTSIDNWTAVPSTESLSYNEISDINGKVYSLSTLDNDQVVVKFPSSNTGSIPSGIFRFWYRTSNALSYTIKTTDMQNVDITYSYTSTSNNNANNENLRITANLEYQVQNSQGSETTEQIRERAPLHYFVQDRIITGDDYNYAPLLQGNQVIKSKALNRTYSGHSRFIDINDPTGNYQNINTFGDDGLIYSYFNISTVGTTSTEKTTLRDIASKEVAPLLLTPEIQNIIYRIYFNPTDLTNVVWKLSNESDKTTGYFEDTSDESRYDEFNIGDMFFSNNIWFSIVSKEQLFNGEYQYSISRELDNDSSIAKFTKNFRSELTNDEINNLVQAMETEEPFGYGFNGETWEIIDISNPDESIIEPIQIETFNSTDWILFLEPNVSANNWVIHYRGLFNIFESESSNKFYFTDSNNLLDYKTGVSENDTISILKYNGLEENKNVAVNGSVVTNYGYADPNKVRVTYKTNQVDDPIEPEIFDNIFNNISSEDLFWNVKDGIENITVKPVGFGEYDILNSLDDITEEHIGYYIRIATGSNIGELYYIREIQDYIYVLNYYVWNPSYIPNIGDYIYNTDNTYDQGLFVITKINEENVGSIIDFQFISGGTGFSSTSEEVVTFDNDRGKGFQINVNSAASAIIGSNVIEGGSGYNVNDEITLSTVDNRQLNATVDSLFGEVTDLNIIDQGTGYVINEILSLGDIKLRVSGLEGNITNHTITQGGSDYELNEVVSINDIVGIITEIDTTGNITYSISNSGLGYFIDEEVTLFDITNSSKTITGTVDTLFGEVSSVQITNGGTGYNVSDIVTFTNTSKPLSNPVVAEVVSLKGQVSNVQIDTQGSGYISNESITFTKTTNPSNTITGIISLSNAVDEVSVTNGSTDYDINEEVIFDTSSGSGTNVTGTVSSLVGTVETVNVIYGGSGYNTEGESVTIDDVTGTVSVQGTVTSSNLTTNDEGDDYESGTNYTLTSGIKTIDILSGTVTPIEDIVYTINSGGTGHNVSDQLSFNSSSGGTFTMTVSSILEYVDTASVTSGQGGTGYAIGEVVTIDSGNNDAEFTVDSLVGNVASVNNFVASTDGGYATAYPVDGNYDITITGAGNGDLVLNVTITSGDVISINSITDGGSGYTTTDNNVPIPGSTGTAATFSVSSLTGIVATGTLTDAGSGYGTDGTYTTTSTGSGTGLQVDITTTDTVTGLSFDNTNADNISNIGDTATSGDVTITIDDLTGKGISSYSVNATSEDLVVGDVLTHVKGLTLEVNSIINGEIITFSVTNGGVGHAINDQLIDPVRGASIQVSSLTGTVTTVTITDGGIGHVIGDILTDTDKGLSVEVDSISGEVAGVTITSGGNDNVVGDIFEDPIKGLILQVTNIAGIITSINITDQGSGHEVSDNLQDLSGDSTLQVQSINGSVSEFTVTVSGSHSSGDILRDSTGGLEITINSAFGAALDFDITSSGSGHFIGETIEDTKGMIIEITDLQGMVSELTILEGGEGHTINQELNDAKGLKVEVSELFGKITSISNIISSDSFVNNEIVTDPINGSEIQLLVDSSTIGGYTVISSGSGYTIGDVIEQSNSTGSGTGSIIEVIDVNHIEFNDFVQNNEIQFAITEQKLDNETYRYRRGSKDISFQYKHYAEDTNRIDPAIININDMYVLTTSYYNQVQTWLSTSLSSRGDFPREPTSYELSNTFEEIEDKMSISDTIVWNSAKYKRLFGIDAESELQATFKVLKVSTSTMSDNELKQRVVDAIDEFFDINNWDFGESFYFTELSTFIHQQLVTEISSIVIVPNNGSDFGTLFEIPSEPYELFVSTATVNDVSIVSGLTNSNLNN